MEIKTRQSTVWERKANKINLQPTQNALSTLITYCLFHVLLALNSKFFFNKLGQKAIKMHQQFMLVKQSFVMLWKKDTSKDKKTAQGH